MKIGGNKRNMKTYRQGEVFLIKIDKLPNNLSKKDNVLAYGETTGNKHLLSKQAVVFRNNNNNSQFVECKQQAELVHEEHKTITLPAGTYKVVLQREFDLQQTIRQVLD